MIIGRDLLLELKLDLCLSNYTIRGTRSPYKGCTAPIKYLSNLCDDIRLINE